MAWPSVLATTLCVGQLRWYSGRGVRWRGCDRRGDQSPENTGVERDDTGGGVRLLIARSAGQNVCAARRVVLLLLLLRAGRRSWNGLLPLTQIVEGEGPENSSQQGGPSA